METIASFVKYCTSPKPTEFTKYFGIRENKEIYPMTPEEWFEHSGNISEEQREKERRVGADKIINPTTGEILASISTVFLFYDHSFGGHQYPTTFETMIFSGKLEDDEQDTFRYQTYAEALQGHKDTVARMKTRFNIPP